MPGKYSFSSAGHWSAVVWNTSKKVSCVQTKKNSVIYCHFSPAGNMLGSLKPPINKMPDLSYCTNNKFNTNNWLSKVSKMAPIPTAQPTKSNTLPIIQPSESKSTKMVTQLFKSNANTLTSLFIAQLLYFY